eukprot:358198_1
MALTSMIPIDPINQTYAIIFSNIPSNYTCKDIILNHLTNKTEINYDRWKKIIRIIEIDTENNKCFVIFSSIFYWCKYSRKIRNHEKQLKWTIHPKYFSTIQHPSVVNFISTNGNNEKINLYNMSKCSICYTFMHDTNMYISCKETEEYLIKIPSENIITTSIIENEHKDNDNNDQENECKYDTDIIFQLSKSMFLYQYYQQDTIWKCNHCNNINPINTNENENKNDNKP